MSRCCATIDPAEIGEESFGLGLSVASLLPYADGVLAVPLRQPLGGECFLDYSERDLHPADDLGCVERAGKTSKLNRSFSAGHQVVDIEKFVPATSRLESVGVPVFLHTSTVRTLLPTLGAGDRIHSFFKVGGGVDEFRQLLCALPFEPDMDMDSAGGVHGVSLLIQDFDDLDELDDPGFASEYRGDDFDSDMSGFIGADTAIILGDPAFRQIGDLFAGRVVAADVESVGTGAGGFDFNAEGKFLGDSVGVGRVSRRFGHGSGVRWACL